MRHGGIILELLSEVAPILGGVDGYNLAPRFPSMSSGPAAYGMWLHSSNPGTRQRKRRRDQRRRA